MNRKKRNLKYIREKNHLRKYLKSSFEWKLSNEIINDVLSEIVKAEIRHLSSYYKMNLNFCISVGVENDDFINDITTVKITFQKS